MPVIYIRGRRAEAEARLAEILNLRDGDVIIVTNWRGRAKVMILRRDRDRWVLNKKMTPSLIDEVIAWGARS